MRPLVRFLVPAILAALSWGAALPLLGGDLTGLTGLSTTASGPQPGDSITLSWSYSQSDPWNDPRYYVAWATYCPTTSSPLAGQRVLIGDPCGPDTDVAGGCAELPDGEAAGSHTVNKAVTIPLDANLGQTYYLVVGMKNYYVGLGGSGTDATAFACLPVVVCPSCPTYTPSYTYTPTLTPTPLPCQGSMDCTNTWFIRGDGYTVPNGIRLTDDVGFQTSAMWAGYTIDMASSWCADFRVTFGAKDATGADGMAFVLHNDPDGARALGDAGQALGYGNSAEGALPGIQPSLAVEFDNWCSDGTDSSTNLHDPPYDHVAVHVNADIDELNAAAGPTRTSAVSDNVEDGAVHQLVVCWNAAATRLEVSVDGALRLSYTADVVNTLFAGKSCVYWGFTASTGGSSNVQEVIQQACLYSPTITPTFSFSPTRSETFTHSPTATVTPTATPTPTRTASPTATASPTPTPSSTRSVTFTATRTATATATVTPTATRTASFSRTPTQTLTLSPPPTATVTPSVTPTPPPLYLKLLPPSPHPATGDEAWLPWYMPVEAEVDLTVWSVAGEPLRRLALGRRPRGYNELKLALVNEAGRRLASGVFLYRLRAKSEAGEEDSAIGKLAVSR